MLAKIRNVGEVVNVLGQVVAVGYLIGCIVVGCKYYEYLRKYELM